MDEVKVIVGVIFAVCVAAAVVVNVVAASLAPLFVVFGK